jgi:hypothetical protein
MAVTMQDDAARAFHVAAFGQCLLDPFGII